MKNNIKHISWTWVAIWLLIFMISYVFIFNYIHRKNTTSQVCVQWNCFTVELARTSTEQELGLMNRTGMDEKKGMLFLFPKSDIYAFRMKNTLIPLDMVRIDDQNRVVYVVTAQPCTTDPCAVYKPEIWARYVLEINAGIAAKYKIVEGTMMKFRNINSPTK